MHGLMMSLKIKTNDIVFVYIEYEDKNDGKSRPALVLRINDENLKCFKITGTYNNSKMAHKYYYKIVNWKSSGLQKQSYIDTHRTIDIDLQHITRVRKFGKLSNYDLIHLKSFLVNNQ